MNDWFWARVQAAEGDLSVSHHTLDVIAEKVVRDYNQKMIPPSTKQVEKYCRQNGVNFDSLLPEEKEYLNQRCLI